MQPQDGLDAQDPRRPAKEQNSLPPVVPEEPEPNSLPPVVPEEPEQNSLPPVVPEEPEQNSLPPVVPDKPEPNSLPPVVPDAPEASSLPPVVPDDDELQPGPGPSAASNEAEPAEPVSPPAAVLDEPEPDSPLVVPHDLGKDESVPTSTASEPAPRPQDVRVFVPPEGAPDVPDVPETAESDAPVAEPAAAQPRSGWAVLGRALAPRATRAQIVAGVLCAVLGFALVAQVRQSGETSLAGMRQGDLVRILDETTNRGDTLAREAADLARERDELLSGSDRRQAALDALRRSAETQGILAGRLPAEGPGVIVTLTESDRPIRPVTMLNMLEEMRNAGAEAIQLNDQRITASSAFTGAGGTVILDGVELTAPYRWIAIGDPDNIAPALQIPGGAMAQVRTNGGKGTVDSLDLVSVDAVRIVPEPVYATPVPPQGD